MHLRVALERLTGKYGIGVKTHEPTVPYKESIRGAVSVAGATRSNRAATASSVT